MKLGAENLKFPGLNEGTVVDFGEVENIEQLKETIVDNYVAICRKCTSRNFCRFYDPSEPPCPILEKVVNNYVDMNIKSVDTANQQRLSEFIKSIVLLIQIFDSFENWRGIYVDERFNWYFESSHPRLNSFYGHDLLVMISKYVRAYSVVETERLKEFVVLVEGESEDVALPPIFEALGVLGIRSEIKDSVKFINMKGKDRIQIDKIRINLQKFREDDVSYFLILDNDTNVESKIEDFKREGLMEDDHYLIWDSKFEDNFGEEAILKVLREEADSVFDGIDIDELKRYNSTKHDIGRSIDDLAREKGIEQKFDNYKIRIAKRLSEWVCREIDESMKTNSGVFDGRRTPKSKSFPDFLEKVRKITETIKRISSEFHVVKDE